MSERSFGQVKWPYVAGAGLFLLLGVDIGMRIASRGPAPVAAAQQQQQQQQAATPAGSGAGPSSQSTKIIVVRGGASGSDSESDPAPSPQTAPPPDPMKEAAAKLVADWAKAPDAGAMYENRQAEPLVEPLSGKAAELASAAEAASSKGEKQEAAKLYQEAEGAAEDPRQKEDLRLRRLWVLFDAGELKQVRQLAQEIGAHPVRAESRKVASELLVKLDAKGM